MSEKMNPEEARVEWSSAAGAHAFDGLFQYGVTPADIDRWFATVEVTSECWNWTGAKNGDGYPYTNLRGQILRGNRLFWMLANRRSIPHDRLACHSCDNRACVNPAHLWLGTLTDNNRDRAAKGRSRDQRGTKNNQAKLDDSKAIEIRRLYKAGLLQREIGAQFGITQTMVGRIVRGKAWTHAIEAQL